MRIVRLRWIPIVALASCAEPADLSNTLFGCNSNTECPPGKVCADDRALCVPPAQLEGEPHLESAELRAMLVMPNGSTRYWYEAQTILRPGLPIEHGHATDDALDVHRLDEDIVGVVPEDGLFRAYFTNGTTGLGDGYVFEDGPSVSFRAGESISNVVGIARDDDQVVHAFFDDGTYVATSDPLDFGGTRTAFTVAEAKTATAVAAVSFDDDGELHTVCHDGTVLVGDPSDLSKDAVLPGRVTAGFVTSENDFAIAYASGWVKVLEGRLTDNWSPPTRWAGDWVGQRTRWQGYVSFAVNPRDVVGIGTVMLRSVTSTSATCVGDVYGGALSVYYDNGLRSTGTGEVISGGRLVGFDVATVQERDVSVVGGYALDDVIDVAHSANEDNICEGRNTFVWLRSARSRVTGGTKSLGDYPGDDLTSLWVGEGRRYRDVVAISNESAAGTTGLWALYDDGTFSRGWSQCLCGFCATPARRCRSDTRCTNERLIGGEQIDCRAPP